MFNIQMSAIASQFCLHFSYGVHVLCEAVELFTLKNNEAGNSGIQLSVNLFPLESSILPRAKRAINQNNVAKVPLLHIVRVLHTKSVNKLAGNRRRS